MDADTKDIATREDTEILTLEENVEDGVTVQTLESQIVSMIPRAGILDIAEEKLAILHEPIDPEIIEIRPDGLIYLPWMEYARRMNEVFGVSWVMVPDGKPKLEGNLVMWGFHLIISGTYMGYAIGEQEYQPNNRRMTWGDACEGAQSNALMRLCAKRLGIGLELWQPAFIRDWKKQYAQSYNGKWRRKDGREQVQEQMSSEQPEPEIQPQRQPEDRSVMLKHIHAYAGDMAKTHEDLRAWCIKQWAEFKSMASLDMPHLLKMKAHLESFAEKTDIQDEHINLIVQLSEEAGFQDIDGKSFLDFAGKSLGVVCGDIGKLKIADGIVIVQALRRRIDALHEAEAVQAEAAQATPQDDDVTVPDDEILMDGPDDLFQKNSDGKISNNPQHKTPEELQK